MAEKKGMNYQIFQDQDQTEELSAAMLKKFLNHPLYTTEYVYKSAAEYTEQPLSNLRKIIAKAMHASLQNSAQLTHHMSADVRNLLEARRKIKDKIQSRTRQQDITLNDMICWCVIRALEKFPEVNSHFLDDRKKIFKKFTWVLQLILKRTNGSGSKKCQMIWTL